MGKKSLQRAIAAQAKALDDAENVRHSRLSRLPNEILRDIITHLVNLYEVAYLELHRQRILLKIMNLSPIFKRVVPQFSQLWAVLDMNMTSAQVQKAMKVSKGHPLDVRMELSRRRQSTPPLETFLEVSSQAFQRWRHVQIDHFRISNEQRTLLETRPAPLLESLNVAVGLRFRDSLNNLFDGQAPRLVRLTLTGICVPWSCPVVSGLTHLSLTSLQQNTSPSVTELLQILRACSGLQHLLLVKACIRESALAEAEPTFELPDLRFCNVVADEAHDDVAPRVLATFDAPRCERLLLEVPEQKFTPEVQAVVARFIGRLSTLR